MNLFFILLLALQLFSDKTCLGTVIIKRDESDQCNLSAKLVEEIASYKNVTETIMNEITQKWGSVLYDRYVEFIDKFGARVSGSEVLEQSIDYMINLAKENGLSDVITEEVTVPHWVRGEETAIMLKPRRKKIEILGLGTTVSTPAEGITADVVVVKSFEELEALEPEKVVGKIVVYDVPFVTYGQTVTYRSQGATKAAEKGAVASLVRSIAPFSLYTVHTGSQRYGENITKIPAAAITHEDADLLRRLQDAGKTITLTIKMFNTFDWKTSRNTILDLKGKEDPNKYVVVSGHIDSWDVGQGAIDDGGGMMISAFAPIILNQLKIVPRRTLRGILWTSEEPGLYGAAAYLEKHMNELNNINFVVESDEGTFAPTGLDVGGTPETRCVIKEILKLFSPIDKVTFSGSPGSDIGVLVEKGVPGASLLNANERYFWYHHTEADTLNAQSKEDLVNCAAFYTAVSYVIADLSEDIPR